MKSLRRLNDNPADLRKRIAECKARHRSCHDLEQRLVVAKCRLIRRELRQERQERA